MEAAKLDSNTRSGRFVMNQVGGIFITCVQIFLGLYPNLLTYLSVIIFPAPFLFVFVLIRPKSLAIKFVRFYLVGAVVLSVLGILYRFGWLLVYAT
jgi:hypothetical protein